MRFLPARTYRAYWKFREQQEAGIAALIALAPSTDPLIRADHASFGEHPGYREHASERQGRLRMLAVVVAAAGLGTACYLFRPEVVLGFMLAATAFNMMVGTLEARWRLHAWRTPEAAGRLAWPRPVEPAAADMSFSLIVPARDEADVIGDTLWGLVAQDHPHVQIVVSLCEDDAATIAAAVRVADRHPDRMQLVVGHYPSPSKALQLNAALRFCTGQVVGVIDAEDDVAGTLLRHVEALFLASGADVVQGGVQLMNLGDRIQKWFQVHNVLEYFFWFTSRMAYQVDAGFVPLGGNTVFVYRDLLSAAGGWPQTLTEDCALGVVLATRFGAKVAAAYSADLSTREESPPTIFNKQRGALFWQRDRWVRGFVTELAGGTWLKMPTVKGRVLAGYILATPLLQAICGILLPFAIVTALLAKAPIGLTLFMFAPLVPLGIALLTQVVGLREFTRAYERKASLWHYASLLVLTPLYQALLMAAAAVAVYKYARGDTRWYKTGRAAEHREPVAAWVVAKEAAALA
jgi:cellulose synthase/poly-beta-1,6-N-acetylglucosamine synthase-like glycosyltransferase